MIPVNIPLLAGNEKKYVQECLDTGWISSEGPFVKRFESEFANYVDREYGIAVTSGSAALDVAVKAIGIGEGDEVIMPTFTIISPAASIVRQGAIPVLVDSDPVTWNMNVEDIEAKITSKTKAILVVHIYGLPVDMEPVLDIAERHKLKIIEDAAEMHGQTYNGQKCGSFGDISIFSFYPNKHITTGEGGMLVTNDQLCYSKCRSLKNLCFRPEKRFVHHDLGWNYRMTNLQAALGVAQLEKIDQHIVKKREIGAIYNELLEDVEHIELMHPETGYAKSIYWIYGILLKDSFLHNAEWVMKELGKYKIGTRPFFYPMHLQPVFTQRNWFMGEQYPMAEKLANRGFYVPSGLGITEEEQKTVADSLKTILSTS